MSAAIDPERQSRAIERAKAAEREWAYYDSQARAAAAKAASIAQTWNLDPARDYEPFPPSELSED
jgi:hypothetical protein